MTNCEEIDYGYYGYSCEEIQESLKEEEEAKMSFILDGSKMTLSR